MICCAALNERGRNGFPERYQKRARGSQRAAPFLAGGSNREHGKPAGRTIDREAGRLAVVILAAEQSELRRVARRLGEAEMPESMRGQ